MIPFSFEFSPEVYYFCFPGGLPQLIFTNGGDVMMADIHGRFVRTLVPSQGKGYALGVAYHLRSDIVFWSDTYNKKVSVDHCLVKLLMTTFFLLLLSLQYDL